MGRKWWTLVCVSIGTLMLLLDVTIVNVALPDIQGSLRAAFSDLQWVIDAYALTLAALLLTTGSLADLFGRRKVFAIGLFLFSVASLACGLATTPLFLDLARGAQGIGGATMFSTSLALLAHSFRGRERGVAFGVWGAVTGFAVAVGPVLGGVITSYLSWRWIFLVNVPIGLVAIILTLVFVEESRDPGARRPDYIGLLSFSGGLGVLVYALINSEANGWQSTLIVGCLAGAAMLLAVFLLAESAQRSPMFDLSLFKKPTFVGGSIAAFSISAGLFSLLLYLVLYLQDVLGYSAFDAGIRLAILSGGVLVAATIAGRLTTFVPIRFLIGSGFLLIGVGLFLMRGLDATSSWTQLIPGFIVSGIGAGLVNPPLASTAIGVVAPARAGMASGINNTFRQVGIATGIAALGAVFQHKLRATVIGGLTGAGVAPGQANSLAASMAGGDVKSAIAGTPPAVRPALVGALHTGFANGLNDVFLIGAILCLVASLMTLVLIRRKDFDTAVARPPSSSADAAGDDGRAIASHEEQSQPLIEAGDGAVQVAAQGQEGLAINTDSVLAACRQAVIDCQDRIEKTVAGYRSAAYEQAEARAQELREQAEQHSAAWAAELRSRLQSLDDRRAALSDRMREQAESGRDAELAQTRREMYELIGELTRLSEQTAEESVVASNADRRDG
jgi:EmrB/QacA subfamily drug resistance transporter